MRRQRKRKEDAKYNRNNNDRKNKINEIREKTLKNRKRKDYETLTLAQ